MHNNNKNLFTGYFFAKIQFFFNSRLPFPFFCIKKWKQSRKGRFTRLVIPFCLERNNENRKFAMYNKKQKEVWRRKSWLERWCAGWHWVLRHSFSMTGHCQCQRTQKEPSLLCILPVDCRWRFPVFPFRDVVVNEWKSIDTYIYYNI